jgi:hypothetical protein
MSSQTVLRIQEADVNEPELIDVDMPFDAGEVEKATSRRYVEQLTRSDMPIVTAQSRAYRSWKNSRASVATEHVFDPIDVDMPFSAAEVAALTSEEFVAALGRSDLPVIGR